MCAFRKRGRYHKEKECCRRAEEEDDDDDDEEDEKENENVPLDRRARVRKRRSKVVCLFGKNERKECLFSRVFFSPSNRYKKKDD